MRKKLASGLFLVFCSLFLISGTILNGQERFNEGLLKNFTYRNLGPFKVSAWVVAIAVPEFPEKDHLYTFYIATRSGGVWRTTNSGTTFEPIFDNEGSVFIGDIALAPSNPDIVWVGTGDSSNRKSSHRGDGVYKSTDGGKTWQNMGLKDTQHIGKIVIHPKNPDIVYVAAIGHLFSYNQERGVFKTEDGGRTWKKVFYINEKVGVIDLVMDRSNPETLYAAAYARLRLPWDYKAGGPGNGIYKTIDGGKTWTKLENGLPKEQTGRIGLDIYLKNPNIVYAWIENFQPRPTTEEEAAKDRRLGLEPWQRTVGADVYRTDDAGETWKKMNSSKDDLGPKMPWTFGIIRVDPNNDKRIYVSGDSVHNSFDGGKTWKDLRGAWPLEFMPKMFGDIRSFWIDPQNSDRIIMGSDGGLHLTYDGGKTCDYYDNLPIGQIYLIDVDMEDPYNIYGGFEDHDLWKGPSNGWSGEVSLEDWVAVGTGDGMCIRVDPKDSRWLYVTSEFGKHFRVDQKLGVRKYILPKREKGLPQYRFAWCPPVQISPHDSKVIYAGAEVLLRSANRGDDWQEISPDLTTNNPVWKAGRPEQRYRPATSCSITTISESPVTPGIIWIGTDDGKIQLTKDNGKNWTDLTKKVEAAGAPKGYWVERVFASNLNDGTAYVCISGHRYDDFRPFLYKTADFGITWTSIAGNLPDEPIFVVIEDKKNPNLLFLGSEKGVSVSIEGGKRWVSMQNNMPRVMVSDLCIHPRENDLVVGTYGRGFFVTNITPIQEMNEKVLEEDIHFFKVRPTVQRALNTWGAYHLFGDRHISTPNEPNGIVMNYYLKKQSDEKAKITIKDSSGKEVYALEDETMAGINTVFWDMRRRLTKEEEAKDAAEKWFGIGNPLATLVRPGEYEIILEVGGEKLTQRALITERAGWPIGPASHSGPIPVAK
jgi:photosystem II stability/assembly factor-like uncharacterized protein